MRSLGVIVGRGQSKRLPRKMLRRIGGHPLIGWACRAAAASALSEVIVSTDDSEIAEAAVAYGVESPFLRPATLSGDNVSNDGVVVHALEWMARERHSEFDIAVLIQPTAPFVRSEDIDNCRTGIEEKGADSCFTVIQAETPPEWMLREQPDGTVEPLIPGPWLGKDRKSHPLPLTLQPNGAVWAMRVKPFLKSHALYSPPMRTVLMETARSVDIDYEHDLLYAEAVAEKHDFSITPAPPDAR